MRTSMRRAAVFICLPLIAGFFSTPPAGAQTGSSSGTITGTVSDPTGAVVPGAIVKIQNPVSQFERTATTDANGHFQFNNVPLNTYHMTTEMKGFGTSVQDVAVHASAPITAPVTLSVGSTATTVEVTGEGLVNNSAGMDTDIDRRAFAEKSLRYVRRAGQSLPRRALQMGRAVDGHQRDKRLCVV